MDRAGVFGLSWTLSRAVAEFFAWRFDAADAGRVLVRATIPRADALAYFNARRESEVIADVQRPVCPVEVLSREPGPAFWQYMDERRRDLDRVRISNDV